MSNKFQRKNRAAKPEYVRKINVVPYVDVTLVLLIIFMITAPLMYQQFDITLPRTESANESNVDTKFVVIDVMADGSFNVNLSGALKENISQLPKEDIKEHYEKNNLGKIFIRSDVKTHYGDVVIIMEELKQINIENIGLITEKE